jgi:hypothetical protein
VAGTKVASVEGALVVAKQIRLGLCLAGLQDRTDAIILPYPMPLKE